MLVAARASGSVTLVAVDDFTDLLNRIADRFPTRLALAKALDINASRLSRALNGTDKHTSFNIENCLKLAQVSGEPPADVLRAAGKGDIAELIESLYGPERRVSDPVVQGLLQHWPTFTAEEKTYVRASLAMVLRTHALAESGDNQGKAVVTLKERKPRRRRAG